MNEANEVTYAGKVTCPPDIWQAGKGNYEIVTLSVETVQTFKNGATAKNPVPIKFFGELAKAVKLLKVGDSISLVGFLKGSVIKSEKTGKEYPKVDVQASKILEVIHAGSRENSKEPNKENHEAAIPKFDDLPF